ncbi:DUF3304 domain-containing protein [Salinicola aestuarinus]|uniref:DUF3304 domain-containing protein n=1 Tax=Salinicola aestuarinus TaxID=1949082 RepID=UPI000DA14651|nr:DUF3304 domain-containing protein [Salinicola aestuarinus]
MRQATQILMGLVMLASLSACGSGDDTADLNVTGVDYAGSGIGGFYVIDPNNEKNRGNGESLTPYSAGGTRCCYQMPQEWHEGLKVDVVVRYPLEGETGDEISASLARRQAEGTLTETIHVDVPKYETPASGTLWVQFLPDKKANVVVSDLSPPHEDFPGEVKGWPVASDQYKSKVIDKKIAVVENRLERDRRGLTKFNHDRENALNEYWELFERVRAADVLDRFSGPGDSRFESFLEGYLKSNLESDEHEMQVLKDARP